MKKAPVSITLDDGETITVHPLLWKDSLVAIRMLAGGLASFSANRANPGFNGDQLSDLIVGSEELITFLLEKSTGRPRTWVDELSFADALPLVQGIIELNVTPLTIQAFQRMSATLLQAAAAQVRTSNN